VLEVRDVTKRYGALAAVNRVSFTVGPGEVLGYLGPNGSGKSTTVNMLVGLLPPTGGTILFDGRNIHEHLVEYKAQVGYVPEEAHVYTYLTGPEYLRMVGRLRGLGSSALERKIDRFLRLFGLDRDYHASLASYSKGMRQKILLSAALLHNPRVLVLDEPESGLDVQTALILRAAARPRRRRADHRLQFASARDHREDQHPRHHSTCRRHRRRRLGIAAARTDEGAVARRRVLAVDRHRRYEPAGERAARDGSKLGGSQRGRQCSD
jgi:ABC-type multidrug transport system ATPase subunit